MMVMLKVAIPLVAVDELFVTLFDQRGPVPSSPPPDAERFSIAWSEPFANTLTPDFLVPAAMSACENSSRLVQVPLRPDKVVALRHTNTPWLVALGM